jgi:hypothetical protein
MGQQRRLKAVACANLEDLLGAGQFEGFDHFGHQRGLGRHLPVGDGQRLVQVGLRHKIGRHERGAWHRAQRLQDAGVAHTCGHDRSDEVFRIV